MIHILKIKTLPRMRHASARLKIPFFGVELKKNIRYLIGRNVSLYKNRIRMVNGSTILSRSLARDGGAAVARGSAHRQGLATCHDHSASL